MNRLKKIWLVGIASIVVVQPVWADVSLSEGIEGREGPITDIPQLSEIEPATTTAESLTPIAQASVIQVTEVRLNPTDAGIEVILTTPNGQLRIPATSVLGNALIVDIPNAVLSLPDKDEFLATEPAVGIALVSVNNLSNRVRVAITGTEAPPTAEVRTEAQGLVLSVAPGADEDEIQVLVTGE